jgi:HlyD family secretion protein
MKKWTPLILMAVVITACDSKQQTNRVVGELASDRVEITAEFNEAIVDILVADGETVSVGQLLLQQDDARATARLRESEGGYLQAKARLDELVRGPRNEKITAARATVEGATQDLDFRDSELSRIREVHERGLASAEALDTANAAYDAAQATLKLRLAQLEELLTGTTIEELMQAEQLVKQAEARRDAAEIDVQRHQQIAPVNGIVDSRLFELGERPASGQPMLVLLDGRQPHARVFIPEQIRVRIKSGSAAIIHVDGLDNPIAGKVRWVASEATFTPYFALTERDRGRLSYMAKIDITEARDRLPDGVPVEVELELD